MTLPANLDAYDREFEALERAANDPIGIRLKFTSSSRAQLFMFRIHQARALERANSKKIYEKDDPRWGKSAYGSLVCRRPIQDTNGDWWVYLEHGGGDVLAIEELSGTDRPMHTEIERAKKQIEHEPQLALPAPKPIAEIMEDLAPTAQSIKRRI